MDGLEQERISSEQMDEERQENLAYEYLCHLEEARIWIEACIQRKLPAPTELEETLRNGVYLAQIGNFINPFLVPENKIYDLEQEIYHAKGLQYRHIDNINYWFKAMQSINVPFCTIPDTTDVYDRRNMPKVVYCLQELSEILNKKGKGPAFESLVGKINFTNEEIDAMQHELNKSGVEMPSFVRKTDETCSLNEKIVNINKALDNDALDFFKALVQPAARIINIEAQNISRYKNEMIFARNIKINNACNRNYDMCYPEFEYNLLTQTEIQQSIDKINEIWTLEHLEEVVKLGNADAALNVLQHPYLDLKNVVAKFAVPYLKHLKDSFEITKGFAQATIDRVNFEMNAMEESVTRVNEALANGDVNLLVTNVCNISKEPIVQNADKFYFNEFLAIWKMSKNNLKVRDICGGMRILNAIIKVNISLENSDSETLLVVLKNCDAHLADITDELAVDYLKNLQRKLKQSITCGNIFLNHSEVQEVLDQTKKEFNEHKRRVLAISNINKHVRMHKSQKTIEALLNPAAGILCVDPAHAELYLSCLKRRQKQKADKLQQAEADLDLEEIHSEINSANKLAAKANGICTAIGIINLEVDRDDPITLLEALANPNAEIGQIIPQCAAEYLTTLKKFKQIKIDNYASNDKENSAWIYCLMEHHQRYYFNLLTLEHSWMQPLDYHHSIYLSKHEIQQIISKVKMNFMEKDKTDRGKMITRLQAYSRGCLVRKMLAERQYHLERNQDYIFTIQNWWRGCLAIRRAKEHLKLLRNVGGFLRAIIKIQSCVRMFLARKHYLEKRAVLEIYQDRNEAIQSLRISNPMKYIQTFLPMLKVSSYDYEEEMELHRIRNEVVRKIRGNRELENKVNEMDLKIALLIRNQLNAHELLSQGNKISRIESNRRQTMDLAESKSLACLQSYNKESRSRLDGYQHLFYALQTNPKYLARLIYTMAPGRSAKFIDTVIYSLYNYGSTPREECLLLQLFRNALEEEVKTKVDKIEDICKGTPLVFKMIVDFNKTGCGHSCLRELLEPLIEDILKQQDLRLSTDPIEVYKHWVNEQELTTGVMSKLPYDLSADKAEQLPEVAQRIRISIEELKTKAEMFINRILESVDLLPYGIRYTSKVLFGLLKEKFPQEDIKKIMKAVGNLLYYRYIIAAIPAADTFGVVMLKPGDLIQSVQRKNLGAIAKVLQHAAAFQLFDLNSRLSQLNPFLEKCHNKCLKFLKIACEVEEPEVLFYMDTYSEATLLTPPQVNLSLQEIRNTHQLLVKYQEQVAPDKKDQLHELLDDLSTPIILETYTEKDVSTPICLFLKSKFLMALETTVTDEIFLTTKELAILYLQCQSIGPSLLEMLRTSPSKEDEQRFIELKRTNECESLKQLLDRFSTLNELRHQLLRSLKRLEEHGLATKKSSYNEVTSSVAKLLANRQIYREKRKYEIEKLEATLEQLDAKTKHFQQTLDYYNEYIQNCLQRMTPKQQRFAKSGTKDNWRPIIVKYCAAKLAEKGILVEITGLDQSQLKHVAFELATTRVSGIYKVSAKFMGAAIEEVDLDVQLLLQKQYEGVTVVEMFGKAKVNINLFLHLINKKFIN